jgi:hypothetical protein
LKNDMADPYERPSLARARLGNPSNRQQKACEIELLQVLRFVAAFTATVPATVFRAGAGFFAAGLFAAAAIASKPRGNGTPRGGGTAGNSAASASA